MCSVGNNNACTVSCTDNKYETYSELQRLKHYDY